MDFSRAWHAMVDDANWLVKILIGGLMILLGFLIIPILFVSGYLIDVIARAARGENGLPEWADWGGLLVRGLLAFVIQVVYALPALLLGCCMAAVATIFGQGSTPNTSNDTAGFVMLCLSCILVPLGLIIAFVTPAALIRFATEGDISAAFDFNAVLALIRDNLGNYVFAVVASILLSLLASLLAAITCGLGAPWFGFAASLLGANLLGQVAFLDRRRGSWGDMPPVLPSTPLPPVG